MKPSPSIQICSPATICDVQTCHTSKSTAQETERKPQTLCLTQRKATTQRVPKSAVNCQRSKKRCSECPRTVWRPQLSNVCNCQVPQTAQLPKICPLHPLYPPLGTFESSSCFPHVQMLCIFDTLNIVCPPIFQLQKLNHVCVRSKPAFWNTTCVLEHTAFQNTTCVLEHNLCFMQLRSENTAFWGY